MESHYTAQTGPKLVLSSFLGLLCSNRSVHDPTRFLRMLLGPFMERVSMYWIQPLPGFSFHQSAFIDSLGYKEPLLKTKFTLTEQVPVLDAVRNYKGEMLGIRRTAPMDRSMCRPGAWLGFLLFS